MAVSMAEDPTKRKACDDCHRQKLKCDRNGKPPCSRCHVKNIECNTSTSRRFKKKLSQTTRSSSSHHHHHHSQPQTHNLDKDRASVAKKNNQSSTMESQRTETGLHGSRTPKRRRTENELDLVQLDAVPQANDLAKGTGPSDASAAAKNDDSVASHALLEMSGLDFNIDSLDFFPIPQSEPQDQDQDRDQAHHHLSLSQPPASVFHLSSSHSFPVSGSWDLHGGHHNQQHHHQQPQTQQHAGLPHLLHSQTLHSGPSYHSVTPVSAPPIPQHHLEVGGGASQQQQHHRLAQPKSRRSSNTSAVLPSKRLKHRRNKPIPGRITLRDRTTQPSSCTQNPLPLPQDWMAQLSDLHTRLLSLSTALHKQQRDGSLAAKNGTATERAFPMEELFQLTRVVVDTLDRVCVVDSDSSIAIVNGSADPASCMMVLSLYIRLLDIYQKVFHQVKCELSHMDGNRAFRSWKLPDVSVGSFAVNSSPYFQMSLAVQVAEEFIIRLSNLTTALDPSLGKEKETSAFVDVVGVSYRALKTKEEDLGKELDDLRGELEAVLD